MNSKPVNMHRGFTIIEVLAVITIASLIAVSIVPATARINDARNLAGVYECARMLEYARTTAAASGEAAGIRFDGVTNTISMVTYDGVNLSESFDSNTLPEPLALGAIYGSDLSAVRFSTSAAISLNTDTSVLWFDHVGSPHLRSRTTNARVNLDQDPYLEFQSGANITVNMISGLVEVEQ